MTQSHRQTTIIIILSNSIHHADTNQLSQLVGSKARCALRQHNGAWHLQFLADVGCGQASIAPRGAVDVSALTLPDSLYDQTVYSNVISIISCNASYPVIL